MKSFSDCNGHEAVKIMDISAVTAATRLMHVPHTSVSCRRYRVGHIIPEINVDEIWCREF